MAITIGGASFPNLTAQPFGYDETDTRAGQTARKWLVTGLLQPSEWLSLLSVYDAWRNTRINDQPTKTSEVIGHTVAFSGNGPSTQTWTNVPCWFIGAPQAEQSGKYLAASVELVDANESLAVILKEKEGEAAEDLLDLGIVTIGTASFPKLTVQPFGYEETDTRAGLAARKWLVTGLLEPSEWLALLGVYDAWRSIRIQDEPTKTSGVVGHTISFSGSTDSQSWSNIASWFIGAPQAEQSGSKLKATVELVDANQALAVLLKQQEDEGAVSEDTLPDLGTITLGGATITLLKPVDTFAQGPQLELTASGVHYVSGPLVPVKVRDIEGTTTESGWNQILAWYETTIASVPSAGSYFPTSPPVATAEQRIISGVSTTVYTVTIQLTGVV